MLFGQAALQRRVLSSDIRMRTEEVPEREMADDLRRTVHECMKVVRSPIGEVAPTEVPTTLDQEFAQGLVAEPLDYQ